MIKTSKTRQGFVEAVKASEETVVGPLLTVAEARELFLELQSFFDAAGSSPETGTCGSDELQPPHQNTSKE